MVQLVVGERVTSLLLVAVRGYPEQVIELPIPKV
jgi:hypothetical protein